MAGYWIGRGFNIGREVGGAERNDTARAVALARGRFQFVVGLTPNSSYRGLPAHATLDVPAVAGGRQAERKEEAMQRLALVGAVLAVGLLSAQTKPNFSGTWTLVSSDAREPAAGAKRFVVILTQTDRALTLMNENGAQTGVFPLDGSESTIKGTNGADVTVRTRWEGAQLLVEQRTATTAIITTVRMSDDGNELTVETLAQGPGGDHREKQLFRKSQ